MATAVWLRPEEDSEWDSFVSQHPLGLIYHLTEWKNALEYAFPHIRGRFLALRENISGRIIAGLPVYTIKSWLLSNRLVSVPFASFCDPLISTSEDFRALLYPLMEFLSQTRSRYVEVRSMKTAGLIGDCDLTPVASYKHHYILLDVDIDKLFSSLSKSSVQQLIRRAQRNRVTIKLCESKTDLGIFYSIVTATRRRLSIPTIPLRFFEGICRYLSPSNRKLFIGWNNGTPIGCLLILNYGHLWAVEYSGDSSSARNSGVNQLLYWEAIKLAHSQGARVFSLGRTSVTNHGLMFYKRRWATVEEDLPHFSFSLRKAVPHSNSSQQSRESSLAYKVARFIIRITPMQVYKKLSQYLYRHLG